MTENRNVRREVQRKLIKLAMELKLDARKFPSGLQAIKDFIDSVVYGEDADGETARKA